MIMNPAGGGGLRVVATYTGTFYSHSDALTIDLQTPASFCFFGARSGYNSVPGYWPAFNVVAPGGRVSDSNISVSLSAEGNTLSVSPSGASAGYVYEYYIYVLAE